MRSRASTWSASGCFSTTRLPSDAGSFGTVIISIALSSSGFTFRNVLMSRKMSSFESWSSIFSFGITASAIS